MKTANESALHSKISNGSNDLHEEIKKIAKVINITYSRKIGYGNNLATKKVVAEIINNLANIFFKESQDIDRKQFLRECGVEDDN